MFYIVQDNKIIFADNDKQRLINTLLFRPDLNEADIQETDKQIENFMFVDSPEWLEWKPDKIRALRNNCLVDYVDPIVGNPLRWADMTAEDQQHIKDYRQYLLAIPELSEFPKVTVLTFEEWQQQTQQESEVKDELIIA